MARTVTLLPKATPSPSNPRFLVIGSQNFGGSIASGTEVDNTTLVNHPNIVLCHWVSCTYPAYNVVPGYPVPNSSNSDPNTNLTSTQRDYSWHYLSDNTHDYTWTGRNNVGSRWLTNMQTLARATARVVADRIYYQGYICTNDRTAGTGTDNNGQYASGLFLSNIGSWRNDPNSDLTNLTAHPDDAVGIGGSVPNITDSTYTPFIQPPLTQPTNVSRKLYNPCHKNGIAETKLYTDAFFAQLKVLCDNYVPWGGNPATPLKLCYPKYLIWDYEDEPNNAYFYEFAADGTEYGYMSALAGSTAKITDTTDPVYQTWNGTTWTNVTYNDWLTNVWNNVPKPPNHGGSGTATSCPFLVYWSGDPNTTNRADRASQAFFSLLQASFSYALRKAIYEVCQTYFPQTLCGNFNYAAANDFYHPYPQGAYAHSSAVTPSNILSADYYAPVIYPTTVTGAYFANPSLTSGKAASSTSNTIVLDSNASTVDGTYYNKGISIVAGTGAGQIRLITGYTGSTKTASLQNDWTVNPDTTSVYVVGAYNPMGTIGSNLGPEQAKLNAPIAAGKLQSATSSTCVLASTSSSTNFYYNDKFVTITGGTGAGQTRKVASYTGSSKTVTVDSSWSVTPDNTSTYIITEGFPSREGLGKIGALAYLDACATDKPIIPWVGLPGGWSFNSVYSTIDGAVDIIKEATDRGIYTFILWGSGGATFGNYNDNSILGTVNKAVAVCSAHASNRARFRRGF